MGNILWQIYRIRLTCNTEFGRVTPNAASRGEKEQAVDQPVRETSADDEVEAARVAADLNYNRNKASDLDRQADRTARDEAMLRHLLREVS